MKKDQIGSASNIFRPIKRFGGPTRPNERFRQSFTEDLVEDEENDDSEWSVEGERVQTPVSPKNTPPEKQRKTGARPKKF